MSIFALGINHKTASVTIREKVYFALDKLNLFLQDLLSRNIVSQAVLLSTCNRSELYCEAVDVEAVRVWFCEQTTLSRSELESAMYIYQDEKAIAHMMEVACGLDSMVIGEPQILGQMKEAFSESCGAGAIDSSFHRLFQQIFAIAKEIRTTTAIGACPVSVASAAVYFAKNQIENFNDANVVIVGAGETTALLLRYMQRFLNRPVTIVNRSQENAEKILQEFGGLYADFSALPNVLADADIVFSATGSPKPIINQATLINARRKKLLLMDIAVPRDIDPMIKELKNIQLFCIDDLKSMIMHNMQGREHAAIKALEMINKKSEVCFQEIYSFDKVAYTIRAYRGQIEAIAHAELIKAKQQLLLGADPNQVLEIFSRAFMNKLLHEPSVQLRQAGVEGRHDLLRLAKQLFALPDPEIESA